MLIILESNDDEKLYISIFAIKKHFAYLFQNEIKLIELCKARYLICNNVYSFATNQKNTQKRTKIRRP